MTQKTFSLLTAAVVAHLIVSVLHGRAHTSLGVALNSWQQTFVIVVILIAPVVAAVLLWTRYSHIGLLLLVASMAGSLIFGVYYHYIGISPDHVAHLPPGDSQASFRLTALLLGFTEMFAVVLGILELRSRNNAHG